MSWFTSSALQRVCSIACRLREVNIGFSTVVTYVVDSGPVAIGSYRSDAVSHEIKASKQFSDVPR